MINPPQAEPVQRERQTSQSGQGSATGSSDLQNPPAERAGLAAGRGLSPIDPAIEYFPSCYCQGAPSFSASFAEKGGKTMPLFSCRIKSAKFPQFPHLCILAEEIWTSAIG
jgi:hypothetical protein